MSCSTIRCSFVWMNYIQDNTQEPVVNQTWINTVLSGLNGKFSHLFVFGHVPARQAYANTVLSTNLPMRDTFLTSIVNAGCTTYFCGHDHFYLLSELDLPNGSKLYQNLVGASGATDRYRKSRTVERCLSKHEQRPLGPYHQTELHFVRLCSGDCQRQQCHPSLAGNGHGNFHVFGVAEF